VVFLIRLEIRTGCHITIPENPGSRKRPHQIRFFFGTETGIEKAKQAILEKAMAYGGVAGPLKKTFKEPLECRIKLNRSTGELLIVELTDEPELRGETVKKPKQEFAEEHLENSTETPIKDILTITLNLPQNNLFVGLRGADYQGLAPTKASYNVPSDNGKRKLGSTRGRMIVRGRVLR
jgi:hypothetical protein